MSTTGTNGAPSTNVVFLLAAGAGLSVASIYYSQPMLGMMGADFHAGVADAGMVPTLTQLGYALGILLLAPLGDRYESPADHSDQRRAADADAAALRVCRLIPAVIAQQPGDRPDRHRRTGHYPRRRPRQPHSGKRGLAGRRGAGNRGGGRGAVDPLRAQNGTRSGLISPSTGASG